MHFWSKGRIWAAVINGAAVCALLLLGCWLWGREGTRAAGTVETYGDAVAAFGVAANVLVASVLVWVTLYYVLVTKGLLSEAALERQDRHASSLMERARNVSGHLDVVWWLQLNGQELQHNVGQAEALLGQMQSGASHGRELRLTLINAGPLPVRGVQAIAYEGTSMTVFRHFEEVPVLPSGEREIFVGLTAEPPALRLELEYDDDDSRRWRKYGSAEPLKLLIDPYAAPSK